MVSSDTKKSITLFSSLLLKRLLHQVSALQQIPNKSEINIAEPESPFLNFDLDIIVVRMQVADIILS